VKLFMKTSADRQTRRMTASQLRRSGGFSLLAHEKDRNAKANCDLWDVYLKHGACKRLWQPTVVWQLDI